MEPKYGIWCGLQELPKGKKIDLSNMPNSYRLVIDFSNKTFVIVSCLITAKNVNRDRFDDKGVILSREVAIVRYPDIFYKVF